MATTTKPKAGFARIIKHDQLTILLELLLALGYTVYGTVNEKRNRLISPHHHAGRFESQVHRKHLATQTPLVSTLGNIIYRPPG